MGHEKSSQALNNAGTAINQNRIKNKDFPPNSLNSYVGIWRHKVGYYPILNCV